MTADEASAGQPLCFVHLFKTAGTSLGGALDRHFAPQDIYPGQIPSDFLNVRPGYDFYRGHVPFPYLAKRLPAGYFIVTLRDPIKRTLSALGHLMRLEDDPLGEALRTKGLTRFLKDDELAPWIANLQVRMLSLDLDDFDHSDAYSMHPVGEGELDGALDALKRTHLVASSERLPLALEALHRGLRCRRRARVPRLNAGDSVLSPSDRDLGLIRALNYWDIKLWKSFNEGNPTGLSIKSEYVRPQSRFSVVGTTGFFRTDVDRSRSMTYTFMGANPVAHMDFDCAEPPRRFRIDVAFSEEERHFRELRLAIDGSEVDHEAQMWPSGVTTLRGDVPSASQRVGRLRLTAKTATGITRPGYTSRQSIAVSYVGLS